MPKEIEQIIVRTKRIGKYRLKKIVSLAYERCEYEEIGGWWLSIVSERGFICGWGETKRKAKKQFTEEFEMCSHIFRNLIRDYIDECD